MLSRTLKVSSLKLIPSTAPKSLIHPLSSLPLASQTHPAAPQTHPSAPQAQHRKPSNMANAINMASKVSFLEATVIRRSTIELKKESTIPDSRIIDIVKHSILHTPSPFHVQSGRAIVLLHQDHEKFWDLALEHRRKSDPPEFFTNRITPNILSFKGSYGTVLFYDDPEAVNNLPPMLGNLVKSFPDWAEHSNGIAQYITWTAFTAEGLGANLQHYQKGLTEQINAEWGLPAHWNLRAQLVFGTPGGPPRGGVEKSFADIEPRVKVFGGKEDGK